LSKEFCASDWAKAIVDRIRIRAGIKRSDFMAGSPFFLSGARRN